MIQSEPADIRPKKIAAQTAPANPASFRVLENAVFAAFAEMKNPVIIGLKLYKTGLYRLLPQVTPEKPLKKEKLPDESFGNPTKIDVVVVSSVPKGRQLNSPLHGSITAESIVSMRRPPDSPEPDLRWLFCSS